MVRIANVVPDNALFKEVLEDPDDDVVLNAANAGKADYIITEDNTF